MGKLAVALIGLGKRVGIHVGDPTFVRAGAILGYDEPEQAACRMPGNLISLEEHLAEYSLRPVLTFFGRELKPSRRLHRVLLGSPAGIAAGCACRGCCPQA